MRSASSRRQALGLPGLRAGLALCLTAAAAVAPALSADQTARPPAIARPSALFAPRQSTVLSRAGERNLRKASWWGRIYTTPTGEAVAVNVSDSYPADDATGQSWADWFAGLVHGSELQLLHVYVATPQEVQSECGNADALGCYGSNMMVVPGETMDGVDPKMIATHEYGHHVAFNRVNPPWQAVDSGTKRWASYANVCARTAAGSAYPGDEDAHYLQNPGEAFAETYRLLNESKAGATNLTWPIVDWSFYPDAAALHAVEQDVLEPWTTPTSKSLRIRLPKAKRVWTLPLATPLDGQLDVSVTLPAGALDDVSVVAAGQVLAQGLWAGTRQKRLTYQICGQRSLLLRVVRKGAPVSFALRVTQP
ncbi:MAG TPA: hypothetical protein VLK53_14770 [Gaiellaceae bacterium]|nr:hypothetical protein [Gaiellaceae bacterium]